jgi:hypothetical protein
VLSLLIWSVVSNYLVSQRESMAVAEGELGRTVIEEGLVSRAGLVTAPLDGLPTTQSTASLCLVGGQWYSTSPRVAAASLPTALVDAVTSGQESTQRVEVDGQLVLAVGMPLTPAQSGFFEVFPLAAARAVSPCDLSLSWAAWPLPSPRGISTLVCRPAATPTSARSGRPSTRPWPSSSTVSRPTPASLST